MHASTLLSVTDPYFFRKLHYGHKFHPRVDHRRLRNSAKGTRVKAAAAGELRWRKSVGRDAGRTTAQRRREKGFFGASRESSVWVEGGEIWTCSTGCRNEEECKVLTQK